MKLLILFVSAVLVLGSGCAAKVGEDKSDDLRNENTNLKVEITKLKLQLTEAGCYYGRRQ